MFRWWLWIISSQQIYVFHKHWLSTTLPTFYIHLITTLPYSIHSSHLLASSCYCHLWHPFVFIHYSTQLPQVHLVGMFSSLIPQIHFYFASCLSLIVVVHCIFLNLCHCIYQKQTYQTTKSMYVNHQKDILLHNLIYNGD